MKVTKTKFENPIGSTLILELDDGNIQLEFFGSLDYFMFINLVTGDKVQGTYYENGTENLTLIFDKEINETHLSFKPLEKYSPKIQYNYVQLDNGEKSMDWWKIRVNNTTRTLVKNNQEENIFIDKVPVKGLAYAE